MTTILQEQGHKVGDRFRIVAPCEVCEPGSIVEIIEDDGDDLPLVRVIKGPIRFEKSYIMVDRHEKLLEES